MSNKIPEWINPFVKSSYQLFLHHDPKSHLPFDAWGLHGYYNKLWLEKLYEMVIEFRKRKYKVKNHLSLFPNLSSTRFLVLMTMIHYHLSGLNKPELITAIQDFFVESIKLRAKEDLFAYDKNIELSIKDVKKILKKRLIYKASTDEAKEIGKILMALASLTHGLYNDWCTDFDFEISGPYKIGKRTILLRSFPDINPREVWKEINWKHKNISIITEYKNMDVKIAFVGCHITYSGSTVADLTGYNFQVDGKILRGLNALKKFREELLPNAAKQYERFMNMDFENQKIKYLYQEHYQFKKLFELVQMDWKPSKEIIARVKGKKLKKDVFSNYKISVASYKEVFGANKMIEAYKNLR